MKRFALALILAVTLAVPAFACNGTTCGCPGQQEGEVKVVEETADLDTAVEEVVKSAVARCDKAAQACGELGQPAEMAMFGIRNTVMFLKHQGVSEADLKPLLDAAEKLTEHMEKAMPLYGKAVTTGRYAHMLAAGDSLADKLRAASLFVEAGDSFEACSEALAPTKALVEAAQASAKALFESLEEEDTDAE